MPLPTPNLDDRRFQDLVDDAKRLVQERCPEWTDHNVADPGVTLIELFAWMTDQVLYRLNRVPDLNYVKFLDLLGVSLFPPAPAYTDLTFWLSSARPHAVRIPAGTQVASVRTEAEEPITFTTAHELAIVPCSVAALASSPVEGAAQAHPRLEQGETILAFSPKPQAGDAFLVGLSEPVPSCAVVLQIDCRIEGIGVDPANPPLVWEAWDGERWTVCDVDVDETGGLNQPGDVLLHVPEVHQPSSVAGEWGGWLRCRVTEVDRGQPPYSASPEISGVSAYTLGGTVEAMHADVVRDEVLGRSLGVPGQRFRLERTPVVAGHEPHVLEVGEPGSAEEWEEVSSFSDSDFESRHFRLDPVSGEVVLGQAVREPSPDGVPNGGVRQYGAVPPKGALLRLRSYETGGGPRGNVAQGVLSVLRSPIPYVASVENRHPAAGGVDGEDIENAKIRGPIVLRTGDRAVTAEDYEQIARAAAPELGRVACVPAQGEDEETGLRVLVVPQGAGGDQELRFEELIPREEQVEKIARELDARRVVGVRIVVEPPSYQGITIAARVRARPEADTDRLRKDALAALYRYFDPLVGGPGGDGWEFGRAVLAAEAYPLLQTLPGTELVEEVRLFPADPTTGDRGARVERIELEPYALVFSYRHRVVVEAD
jgi:predicted phage baseplate assembly protein